MAQQQPSSDAIEAINQLFELSASAAASAADPQTHKQNFQSVLNELLLNREKKASLLATTTLQQQMLEQQREAQLKLEAQQREAQLKLEAQQQHAERRQDALLEKMLEQQAKHEEAQRMLVDKLLVREEIYKGVMEEMKREGGGIERLKKAAPPARVDGERGLSSELSEPPPQGSRPICKRKQVVQWQNLGDEIVNGKGITAAQWIVIVEKIFAENEALTAPVVERCPLITIVLANAMEVRTGFRVQYVPKGTPLKYWTKKDARRVGRSMSTFVRQHTRTEMAVEVWKMNYPQLCLLFVEVDGFEGFMNIVAEYVLKHNKAGLLFRVSSGAVLSILDGFTDIYVIVTYFRAGLRGQGYGLIAMCATSMFTQIINVLGFYAKKSWGIRLKEILICLTLLRPAVDAYRISTNREDDENTVDPLAEVSTFQLVPATHALLTYTRHADDDKQML